MIKTKQCDSELAAMGIHEIRDGEFGNHEKEQIALKHGEPEYPGTQSVSKKAYKKYIASKGWRAKASQLKQKYPKCRLCNQKGELHVHHCTYVRLGNEWDNDLVVLCASCHLSFHGKHEYNESMGAFEKK